jgi:3-oxoacyl-[acyl-carrier-protein] synthase II
MGALSVNNDNPGGACRPFDLERDGFVMSEGAVVLVLEELEHAKKRKANILAEFIGYGTSVDANHMASPLEDAAGAILAIRRAVKRAGIDNANITSSKSMTGHLFGAAGAMEALVCVKTLTDGIISPTINYETPDPECDLNYTPNVARPADVSVAMSNSFGLGGHNATIILFSENIPATEGREA